MLICLFVNMFECYSFNLVAGIKTLLDFTLIQRLSIRLIVAKLFRKIVIYRVKAPMS